jgi:hypothetical protein
MTPQHRRIGALLAFVLMTLGADLSKPPTALAASVNELGWTLRYAATDGDGTRFTAAAFNGSVVFARLDLPFVFVTYSETQECCTDQLSNAVRDSGPTKTSYTNYFEIASTYGFGSCSGSFAYKYVERYQFYGTGQLRAMLVVYGPGIYPTARYEAFWRVDFDITEAVGDIFQQWVGGSWTTRQIEGTYCDDGSNDPSGREWRQRDPSPSRHYSVNPYSVNLYYCDLAVRYHTGEFGATSGSHPYPTSYATGESINDADVVQWWWGKRDYVRPAGCDASGSGCVIGYQLLFDAFASGY